MINAERSGDEHGREFKTVIFKKAAAVVGVVGYQHIGMDGSTEFAGKFFKVVEVGWQSSSAWKQAEWLLPLSGVVRGFPFGCFRGPDGMMRDVDRDYLATHESA